jgi:2-methylcitrate dehydratase PrpD
METVTTTISQLADFVDRTRFADLPASIVSETKRLLLDSIGCALAGVTSDKGKWGLTYARAFFAGSPQATVIGFGDRMSALGAAFVNGELINGLDYDAAGKHLPPFVIPASLAVAELNKVTGKELITACALAHEIGIRIGGGMSSYRDIVNGKTSFPPVSGHSCAIFGGAAAVAKLERFSKDQLAQALSLAGLICPMQIQANMVKSVRPSTAKYLLAGWVSQAEITAVYLVKAGHRGDVATLDGDYGFWRYAGSSSWNADSVVAALGKEWRFPRATPLKLYPCCRIMHGALDCLAAVIEKNGLRPQEIDSVHAYLEASCTEPVFSNRDIRNQVDAQFSVAYNLSVLTFGIKPGIRWQEWDTLNNPEIRQFMDKVAFEPHPGYVEALKKDPQSRISKVEVSARGKTFVEEREYIKGTPTSDPATYITDAELMAKFKDNACRILPPGKMNEACSWLMDLDSVDDITTIIELLHL